MATFVLLHGSFHAAWNWHRVVPLLEAAGHTAVAIDLPGHGRDRTPAHRVTLDRCVELVLDVANARTEKVVLLAHSRNGIVISQAAERRPDRISGLIYLAAYLVPSGRSMMEYALGDRASLVVQNVSTGMSTAQMAKLVRAFRSPALRALGAALLARRFQTHALRREAYRDALYHDCDPEITALASVLLEPEPNWAGFTPLTLTDQRYGRVPKVYVECLQDRAVTPALQRRMQRDVACDAVFSLDTSHSPFFSRPAELADAMVRALDVFATCRGGRDAADQRSHGLSGEDAGCRSAAA